MGAKALVALVVLSAATYWVTGLSSPTKKYVSMPTLIQEAEKIPPPSVPFSSEKQKTIRLVRRWFLVDIRPR